MNQMNEDLSSIIEQALRTGPSNRPIIEQAFRYASPLPTSSTLIEYWKNEEGISKHCQDFTQIETVKKDADQLNPELAELGIIHNDFYSKSNHDDKHLPSITLCSKNVNASQTSCKTLPFSTSVLNDCTLGQHIDNQGIESAKDGSSSETLTNSSNSSTSVKLNNCRSETYQLNKDLSNCSPLSLLMECNTDSDCSSSGVKSKMKQKRKSNRCLNPLPPDSILPPCRVCDERSSGYHYGVNTCEACKGFFRRALRKGEVRFTCKCTPEEHNLWLIGPYKNGCPSCRYDRCLHVGMSRNDVTQKPSTSVDSLVKQKNTSNSSDATSSKEIVAIVNVLTEAHKLIQFEDNTSYTPELIKQKHTEYLEKYKLKTEIFGAMPPLTREEFLDFYETTGIDVDGRIGEIESAMKFFEKKIASVIAFAKTIPGFKQLCLDDQSNLIKSSRIESTLVSAYRTLIRNVSRDLNVATTPWGKTLHINEMSKVFPSFDVIVERFKFAERLMSLGLTSQEDAILRAILITFADRGQLKEPEKIEAIQEKLMTCLEHLLNVRPAGSRGLLYKIIDVITDMRGLTERSTEMEKQLFLDLPLLSGQNYALIKEFMS